MFLVFQNCAWFEALRGFEDLCDFFIFSSPFFDAAFFFGSFLTIAAHKAQCNFRIMYFFIFRPRVFFCCLHTGTLELTRREIIQEKQKQLQAVQVVSLSQKNKLCYLCSPSLIIANIICQHNYFPRLNFHCNHTTFLCLFSASPEKSENNGNFIIFVKMKS